MKVIADTPVWSAAFRRGGMPGDPVRMAMVRLVQDGLVSIIGPIRQEILSGIRERPKYVRVRDGLRSFPDIALQTKDFEMAAECFNECRTHGVQGSFTDFLICAVALRHKLQIFTTDHDFALFRKHLPIELFE